MAEEVVEGVEDVAEIHEVQVSLRSDEAATSIRQLKVF